MTNYFKNNLKYLRAQRGWSQAFLAQKLDKHRTSVSAYESKDVLPDLNEAIKIAELFGITLNDLTGRDLTKEKYTLQEENFVIQEQKEDYHVKDPSNLDSMFRDFITEVVEECNEDMREKVEYIYNMMRKIELEKLLKIEPGSVSKKSVQ
ncbi:MAG: helix-turn-helix transcriptional regulator [Bacteroidota bacterium]